MEAEHNSWLDQLDTSHIAPLDDDWAKHPFWADAKDLQDESTEAGQLVKAMQGEFSPTERASSCKVCAQLLGGVRSTPSRPGIRHHLNQLTARGT